MLTLFYAVNLFIPVTLFISVTIEITLEREKIPMLSLIIFRYIVSIADKMMLDFLPVTKKKKH